MSTYSGNCNCSITAFVIASDDTPEDHVRKPSRSALDVLGAVMRRDEVDSSAHDVMRHNLARSDDLSFLADLYEEARRSINDAIGPDRSPEIANRNCGRTSTTRRRLREAGAAVRRAEERIAEAKIRAEATEHEPLRARLPGRFGEQARYDAYRESRGARWSLEEARRTEQQALREVESARHALFEADSSAKELATLRDAQLRREQWLRDHTEEVRWALDLDKRIEGRTPEGKPSDVTSRQLNARSSIEQQIVERQQRHREQQRLDPATAAVLRPSVPNPTPTPYRRPPEREGPSLGR